MGFKDIGRLVDLLIDVDSSEIGDLQLLQRYQRARKVDNESTDLIMSALYSAYRMNAPIWKAVRGVGMNWLSSSGATKRMLAKQAMGL